MSKEKGITLIALVITIIVIIILAGITTYEGTQLIKESKLQTVTANMLLIQAKAETLRDKKEFNNDAVLIGEEVTSEELEGWYKWDEEAFEEAGLTGIDKNDVYYVNYNIENSDEDVEVYYEKGYTHTDRITYHYLSEIKNLTMDD